MLGYSERKLTSLTNSRDFIAFHKIQLCTLDSISTILSSSRFRSIFTLTLFAGGHGAGEAGHLPQPRGVRGEELTGGLGLGLLPDPGGLHQGGQRVGGLQERVADLAEFTMVTCDFK